MDDTLDWQNHGKCLYLDMFMYIASLQHFRLEQKKKVKIGFIEHWFFPLIMSICSCLDLTFHMSLLPLFFYPLQYGMWFSSRK